MAKTVAGSRYGGRVRLLHSDTGADVDPSTPEGLRALYAPPRLPWLRVNMVSSVDGAATGADGRSGTVNNEVDVDLFHTLRELADVVLVGAGTARAESYSAVSGDSSGEARPLVLVSSSGRVPERLRDGAEGAAMMATVAAAPHLDEARRHLGDKYVLVAGERAIDAQALLDMLHEQGLRHVLCEGGPTLLGALLSAGVVDELCHTTTPRLLAGEGRRIVTGPPFDVPVRLGSLLEHDGTLIARWLLDR